MLAAFVPLRAAITQLTVTSSLPSPQGVGTIITWSASAVNSDPGPLTYKFEVAGPGTSTFQLLRDFSLVSSFPWTPSVGEGAYQIRVTARDYLAGTTAQQTVSFSVTSRLAGGQAAVTPTSHPLVALLSAPTCAAGSFMRVVFQRNGSPDVSSTNWRPCHPGSMNFYVAGMRPNQLHNMNYQVATGSTVTTGPNILSFTTGPLPPGVRLPNITVPVPASPPADLSSKILLTGYVLAYGPVASDLSGTILWYYPSGGQLTRPLSGGTMLIITNGQGTGTGVWGNPSTSQILREFDLAGNTLRETNVDRVNEQLMAAGTDPIARFHHDAIRLPDGNTMVLGDVQRVFPAGTQGSTEPVDIIGDLILVLDRNWQVLWYWNAFDHAGGGAELDIQRPAILGEVCLGGRIGCPPALLPGFTRASDWLHANSLQYVQADGSVLVSIRNQSWVVKIDYGNGAGTGNILWRLGLDGDFTINSSDPYPWFGQQHDAAFESAGNVMSLFDNGNSRVAQLGGNSRGQVLLIDESSRTASLQLSADLGIFTPGVGSAQQLSNGNWFFQASLNDLGSALQQSTEFTPAGLPVSQLQAEAPAYRSWRMPNLYNPSPY